MKQFSFLKEAGVRGWPLFSLRMMYAQWSGLSAYNKYPIRQNYELIQLSAIGTNCTRRKISRSMGPWNKPERRSLARGFMLRKPVDRRRGERDSSGHPSGNIDLKQRKDWSIWADKMISSCGIYSILQIRGKYNNNVMKIRCNNAQKVI